MACGGKEFHREYFPDGSLREEYEVKNGEYNGIGRMFHKNGTVSYEGKFVDGKRSGWHIHYGLGGQITHTRVCIQLLMVGRDL
jgi:antitoxin component YwqK of YwqJK toxin-antitoxin module